MMPQQYCLRWKHHHSNVQNMFAQLLEKERFCDVTLYCSPSFASQVPNKDTVEPQSIRGVSLRAHRVVLAACSELLGTLLGAHEAHGEPVLVIDGAEPKHLKALLDYMYTGEMNVHHSQLASLLKTAEELRIKGLTDIRWNNKDEPPDCASVATTTVPKQEKTEASNEADAKLKPADTKKQEIKKQLEAKLKQKTPDRLTVNDLHVSKPPWSLDEKININGGPPPLIKLPLVRSISTPKREDSDTECPSPKRRRVASGNENPDEEYNCIPKTERDSEQWRHGNMDISASRVGVAGLAGPGGGEVAWGGGSLGSASDEEWADAPADIGSFLHTRLRVDGDNSADEESNDSSGGGQVRSSRPESAGSTGPNRTPPLKQDPLAQITLKREYNIATVGPKSGPTDPRFTDVIKLNDYLQHGRRPQFWEEHYVKRVMEAVRLKELEMKQAAEILGVSYGTLYGRYRDVYGCINRPYRAVRDFWQVKGPSEVLERLQRGEISLDTAASALGVSVGNLAAHVADFPHNAPLADTNDFEPIPIEIDPNLRSRTFCTGSAGKPAPALTRKSAPAEKPPLVKIAPKVVKCLNPNARDDDDAIPASIISTADGKITANDFEQTSTRKSALPEKPPLVKIAPKVVKCLNPNARDDDDDAIPASIISTADGKITANDFEPIPIEIDPNLRSRTFSTESAGKPAPARTRKSALPEKPTMKIAPKVVKCLNPNARDDDDAIPASIISTADGKITGGKWPSIRVASIDSLRDTPDPASPSQLMRTRPDLTIVAKRPDIKEEDT